MVEGIRGQDAEGAKVTQKAQKNSKKMVFLVGLVIATRLAGCLARGLFKSDKALIYFSGKTKL